MNFWIMELDITLGLSLHKHAYKSRYIKYSLCFCEVDVALFGLQSFC